MHRLQPLAVERYVTPHIYTPHIYTPHIYTPHIYTPHIYTPHIYTPHIYTLTFEKSDWLPWARTSERLYVISRLIESVDRTDSLLRLMKSIDGVGIGRVY